MTSKIAADVEHVYEPRRGRGVPLHGYLKRVWDRRAFLYYRTRAELKARHFDTWFGQLWTLLSPLLLASVYWLLVAIVRGSTHGLEFLTFIIGGLFAFYYTRNAVSTGATSVVSGGGLITNTTMPRALLPMSSVLTALFLYLPTLVVYAIFHALAGFPVGTQLLALPVIVAIQTVFNLGLAMLLGTLSVYFRDMSSLLPYALRIWLYLTPVLYRFTDIPDSMSAAISHGLRFNPMYPIIESWHQVLSDGRWPDAGLLLMALAWAVAVLTFGSWYFMSREREFAVRI